jgi:predicted nucleotidyltransferase
MFDYGIVNKVVDRIVSEFSPRMVVIFGSAANRTAADNSDLDIFIVMETELSYHRRATAIHMKLLDIPLPMDIIAVTPEEYEANKDNEASFMSEILSTGEVVYAT